jgi:hypothetical protein
MSRIRFILSAALALASGHALSQTSSDPGVSFGLPAPTGQLSTLRGGTDTTINDMRLHGTTSGNSARDVQTGNNIITDGALAHLSGIPVVVQNSGANVLIQNALILNLQLR